MPRTLSPFERFNASCHGTHRSTSSGPERSLNRLAVVRGRKGTEKKFEANDVKFREVRCGHSSCETREQRVATPCGAGGAKGRSRGKSGRLKDAPYSVDGESVMKANWIRKAAKRNPEGCLTLRAPLAQRVGIPKPIEPLGINTQPTGGNDHSATSNKAVKDTLSVSLDSRS